MSQVIEGVFSCRKNADKILYVINTSSVNSDIELEALHMKYFLKRTMLKKGEYRRDVGSRNRSFKALGYVEELKEGGIKDPVA